MRTNRELIENYGLDIKEYSDISPFELINTLCIRDILHEKESDLSLDERMKLGVYDRAFLHHAEDIYLQLKDVQSFVSDKPLAYWWRHLDRVAAGELVVDLKNNKVSLKSEEEHAATLTA